MEHYSVVKRNELSSHEIHGGTINADFQLKEASLKRLL